ncbi:MAG: dicarboxylate/amino acid:cation symporter [Candidatus Omnitrophica bacterium]|nr:dicarboxylate/amino acid:cation symporter [Candidatus Omnitrophota bacterium]
MGSIIFGAVAGLFLKERAVILKPLGDIFLNLLFTSVVPLVFFSIASSVASISDLGKLGRILGWMLFFFTLTGLISSSLMLAVIKAFPPAASHLTGLAVPAVSAGQDTGSKIVSALTTADFVELLSKKNMLALIIFALLTGLASSLTGSRGRAFSEFLASASEVMTKLISLIMLYAPIGLAAYFAYLSGVFGPQLMGSYLHAILIYYPVAILYFFASNSAYSFFAGGAIGMKKFWSNISLPTLTALGTGSSLATIPSNIKAADEIGIPHEISRVVIPIGATIHMDGTCISAILKISVLFSLYGMHFSGIGTYVTALGVALLSGMVMTGIPGGGFLGELLIVTLYGFPPEALPIISMIGTLVDPPATMVNAVGSNVVSMMVARMSSGPKWMENSK